MQRILIMGLLLVLVAPAPGSAVDGKKAKRPRPYEYGRVTIDNFSSKAGIEPVFFEHWSHRDKYTCRLCHVDLGFAMKAGGSEMTAADNQRGYFCGSCHDGKRVYNGREIFAACTASRRADESPRCQRCHATGRNPAREQMFADFAAKMPKERFGNGVDWERAEDSGLIKPQQYLEGLSVKRPPLAAQKDFAIEGKVAGMPDIVFSHKKHTVWNGCELCHPDIFVGIKKGATKYNMAEIFAGQYCGVCHVTVAFPLTDCQRCHTQPVN